MRPANLNVRVLSDDTLFVQYHLNGKALDGSFAHWDAFIDWLYATVTA